MSKELIEQLAKDHFPIVRTFEKWVATGSPNRFGAVSGEYRNIFTIEATSEQLEAFAKAYQAAAPIDNVAEALEKAASICEQSKYQQSIAGQDVSASIAKDIRALIPTQAKKGE
jgi:hypothetical protein